MRYTRKKYWFNSLPLLLIFAGLVACQEATHQIDGLDAEWPQMEIPADNGMDADKVSLGDLLFHDPALSIDSSVSCASCHLADYSFADTVAYSTGVYGRIGVRNSPSLLNTGFHPHYMREGGVENLEMQVLVPLQDVLEMDHNIVAACDRLNQDSFYVAEFQRVFNDSVTPYGLVRAIANYERTLISNNAPIDRYLAGEDALSKEALRGAKLFYGKANCVMCHSGILFSDFDFASNGTSITDGDIGRQRHTLAPEDAYTFKTPSLRNLAKTAPYMHTGELQTLDEVLQQYNSGGTGHAYTDPRIEPLNLNSTEIEALKAFLLALSE